MKTNIKQKVGCIVKKTEYLIENHGHEILFISVALLMYNACFDYGWEYIAKFIKKNY